MKKLLLPSILLFFLFSDAYSQAGMWTWMKGAKYNNSAGSFGTQGVPANSNTPPAVYEPCSFKDNQGNFWIYGGVSTTYGNLNDLWKYNPQTNQWTWMKGTASVNNFGNSGIQGVPSPTNQPCFRGWGTPCWTDLNGNFWMYGGNSGWDDLWKYDISSNEWTWMKGTILATFGFITPVYGMKGIPSILNTPGSRVETAATWVDNLGDLWMFGGASYLDLKNDLWKYDISLNMWTWMSGDSIPNTLGNYGVKNVFSSTNLPESRCSYSAWKDGYGKFYLFGGFSDNMSQCGYIAFNDLWCFNPQTNLWAWVGGTSTINDTGYNAGTCIEDPNNIPWNTWENRATSKDNFGNVYMFGGIASACSTYIHQNNELWVYKECTKNWVFLKSGPSNGNYGTKGVPSISNSPRAQLGSVSWIDTAGNFWIFGGTYNGNSHCQNALWKFTPDSNCSLCNSSNQLPLISFATSDTTFCEKKCLDFFDLSTNNPTSWQWFFPGSDSLTSTLQNPTNICYNNYGTFDLTLIACNANGCDTLTLTNFISCYQNPADSIYQSNDTLFSLPAYTYQWYEVTGGIIAGATNQYFIPQQAGSYYCVVSDANGCVGSSGTIDITGINQISNSNFPASVIPNPFNDEITITFLNSNIKKGYLAIKNTLGQEVYMQNFSALSSKNSFTIDLSFLPKGIYLLDVMLNEERCTRKIVKD